MEKKLAVASRRTFLGRVGVAAVGFSVTGADLNALGRPASPPLDDGRHDRVGESFFTRERAARDEREVPTPAQIPNDDERRFPSFIGNFSKGLPHNSLGEVDANAYQILLDAVRAGTEGHSRMSRWRERTSW